MIRAILKRTSMTAALVLAFGTAAAIPITGTNDSSNTAEMDASWESADRLLITIQNTSAWVDSLITGFAFSLTDGTVTTLVTVNGANSAGSGWSFSTDASSGNAFNLDLDYYTITGNNIQGGSPQDGIGVGSLGRFVFGGNFLTTVGLSDGFARWQRTGADGEGSDYGYGCTDDPCMKVSEPASLTLFGLGLVFAGVAARRRRQQI